MNEDDYNKLQEQVPSKSDEVTRENIPEGQIPSKSDKVTQKNTPEREQKLINAHLSASVLQRPPNELINVNVVRACRPRICEGCPSQTSSHRSEKICHILYAFLGNGSDATLCLEIFVQELSIDDVKA